MTKPRPNWTHTPYQKGHLARGGKLDLFRRGEQAPTARLTETAVREIRESNKPDSYWAKRYGVTSPTIHRARTGKSWSHLQ